MVKISWKEQCNVCVPVEQNTVKAEHFERCQWQKSEDPSMWYILYRWFLACSFLSILLWSLLDTKRHPKNFKNSYQLWPAFLTNWAITICTLQAIIGLWIVQVAWINKSKTKNDWEESALTPLHKVYWVLQILGIDLSFTVTIIYWALVHDPAVHKLDGVNFLVHAGNSIFMFLDLLMVMHPCRFIFALFTMSVGFSYSVFSYVYFVCGGIDRSGNPYLYKALDWRKPGKSAIFSGVCIVATFLLHCIVYGLFKLRIWLSKRRITQPSPAFALQEKSAFIEQA